MTMLDYEDVDHRLTSPAADRVARRALLFAALVCRSALEPEASNPDARRFHHEMLSWLEEGQILKEAEPHELSVLHRNLGDLREREEIDAGWRGEALGILAWSLSRYELPSYQYTVESPDAADSLGFLEPSGLVLPEQARLRHPDELSTVADRLFALHWRLRQFSLDGAGMDFESFARTANFGPLDVTGLQLVAGDLAIDNLALSEVDEVRWQECMSIARERQQAANWLCGHQLLYSEVTGDT